MTGFLNFYYQKRKHTTYKIPAEIFKKKYDDSTIRKEGLMVIEQSRKWYFKQIDFEEEKEVLVANW